MLDVVLQRPLAAMLHGDVAEVLKLHYVVGLDHEGTLDGG